ncbi:hypothetical protein J2Z40_002063 [Cytobacillus eiseniae]|uniref:SHOCT domain-containing protein n=1 Tax=Cytobacillus eiseniae TaxID=762947 RepID=A0ABS4RGK3_9BACI|nr:hypothetical protein [Cytobacillus eiseniae]MBP2241500.1 hypothetical protein [Cytobacillus eiseniae]
MIRKFLTWIGMLFLFLSILPGQSNAQEETPILKMEELKVQVMPEYAKHPEDKEQDHPSLLIGYHGTLVNNTDSPLKGQIEIPLPMNEDEFRIGFVADYNRNLTELNEIEYEKDQDKGTISWETTEEIQPNESYKFVIEYYTAQLVAKGESKKATYQFKSFANIGLVNVIFLEPLKSEQFQLTPPADSHQENGYGMNMFSYQIQGMKPDDIKEFQLEYTRAETRTTMDIMAEMTGDPAHGKEAVKQNETLPIWQVIALVGGICIVAAVLILFLLKRKKPIQKAQEKETKDYEIKKQRLRAMLLDGSISEQEYNELMKKE